MLLYTAYGHWVCTLFLYRIEQCLWSAGPVARGSTGEAASVQDGGREHQFQDWHHPATGEAHGRGSVLHQLCKNCMYCHHKDYFTHYLCILYVHCFCRTVYMHTVYVFCVLWTLACFYFPSASFPLSPSVLPFLPLSLPLSSLPPSVQPHSGAICGVLFSRNYSLTQQIISQFH